MCGIFGWHLPNSDQITRQHRLVLATALSLFNDTRGGHSWGVASIVDKGRHRIFKGLGDIAPQAIPLSSLPRVLCHTRFATHGKVNTQNAHPFRIGDIIGAHNGVLSNHQSLNTKYGRKCEVDSMHIFLHMDQKLPMEEIEGYGAIEWAEIGSPEVMLCKMRNGSLSVRSIEKDNISYGVAWSSDDNHLFSAIEAMGMKSKKYSVEENTVYIIQDKGLWISESKIKLSSSVYYGTGNYNRSGGSYQGTSYYSASANYKGNPATLPTNSYSPDNPMILPSSDTSDLPTEIPLEEAWDDLMSPYIPYLKPEMLT